MVIVLVALAFLQYGNQLSAAAGYEISFTVLPLGTYSYRVYIRKDELLTYSFSVTGGDGSIKFAIKDSGGKIVSDAGKVHYYYSSEFRAPKSDTYSLYFSNRFATIHSKHVRLTYEVRPPSPPPPHPNSYLRIAGIDHVPPNIYFITVEAAYFTPCWCLVHRISLSAAYVHPPPGMPSPVVPIESWTIPNDGELHRRTARWECPHEGYYVLIAIGDRNLKHEVSIYAVPEFSNAGLMLIIGLATSLTVLRAIRKKRCHKHPDSNRSEDRCK